MIKSKNLIFLTVLLNILWFSSVFGGEVDFNLRNYILQNNAEGYTPVIVVLADRFDAARAVNSFRTSKIELAERHRMVVNELKNRAVSSQSEVINKIEQLKSSGGVLEYTPLWISNMIGMTAKLSAIDEIAGMPEVETVVYDAEMELIEPVPDTGPNLRDDIESVETGLTAIRADEVWAMGITGRGVVVSHLDTGVDGSHPALYDRWRGHDPRYANNPEWAWHDPITHTTFPFDDGMHGTHTMGTICGRSNNSDDTIGVAIDAEWISAGVIDRGGDLPTRMLRYMLSFQWIIDPDGDPETFWDVPAVCSNSWGHTLSSFPRDPCNEYYWETLDNMEAAGICVVFAAGNEGNEGLRVPANRATDAFNSFAVGAVDGNNPQFPIAGFSSRGPSYCTPDGRPAIKPEVVAPGVSVRSASPGGGYRTASGTSMACPHVAGVVALMKQANPNLAPEEIKQILMDTASDLGDPGEDNTYGWGIIDACEAVNAAIAMLDDYGYVTGRITDITSGDPLFGKVSLIDHIEPIFGYADPDGYYGIWIPADTSLILKAEYPPDYLPSYDTIAIAAHETLTVDFALEPRVPVILRASFGNPDDIAYKTFYCKGSWDADGFYSNEWSAPFNDMRDDGRYPDQVANDGVFTGEVKLATDTINTYQWAVYSENYTDEAFLQAGQGFSITNPANPPVVPVLSVNPSGVQHDWTLTVFDSVQVMVSDLSPGYGGLPYQWSGTTTMQAGTTYDFRIYPMRALVASYGFGGVGGPGFRVTPNYTEEFTFIFNDSNDSLVIDSDHPAPGGFRASDDMDEKIDLAWLIPRIDPVEYFIYRSDNETGPFIRIGSVSHPDTTYLDEPVNNHQDYYYYVTANYTGNIESIASNIDRGYAVVGARLAVDPSNFEVEVRQGQNTIRNLYITNEGELDLHYELTAVQDGMSRNTRSAPDAPQPFTRYGSYGDKVDSGDDPFLPPNVDSRGGPDSAGYVWIDSDQNGGPDYNWIDITGIGTPVDLGDDENVGPFQMNFDFDFYDSTFNSYRICSNGFVSFTSTAFIATNARIPWANSPENLLALFWDDLDPTAGGQVYRYESDDTVIVSYENIPRYHTSDYFTFQVLMLSSGSIVFQYNDVDSAAGNSATIGIQNGDGSIGLEVVYNEHYVHNNLAILFQRTWLYTFPFAGVVEPGMTDTVDIVFDASYLEPGDFIGHLAVEGFDLYHNEPSIDVPVVMHVTPYTSVDEDHSANLPKAFRLYQNYPNPFNPSTEIRYDLPAAGEVRLEIYNILGQLVDVPVNEYQQAGYKSVRWDGTGASGRRIASGVYFYRLKTGEYSEAKKMLLLK